MAIIILFLLRLLVSTSGFEDLSFNKNTGQSSTPVCETRYCAIDHLSLYQSGNAVDRNTHTCATTRPIRPQSGLERTLWYVDLGSIYNVYEVRIVFGKYAQHELINRGYFAGFSLYLSNSSNIDDGLLCYKDGPDLPPLDINVTCPGYARYVFYYNERLSGVKYPVEYALTSITELCEVFVFGCAKGFYGLNCVFPCHENCQGKICDIINGTCYGCEAGWTEDFCNQECSFGSYGLDCQYQCSGHCLNGCNHVTGECTDNCAAGWTGTFCAKPCDIGKYGLNCAFNCSGHCKDNVPCNRETGHCNTGCTIGYEGEFCSEACSFGRFGNGCENICSGHCLYNETCNHVNGLCSKGCAPGYYGSLCSKVCPSGSYGLNCSGTCSRNCIGTCGNVDGSCKCVPGFSDPPNCTTECLPGFYGINCQYRCSGQCVNNENCSRFDGSCSLGCKDNYVGVACDSLHDSSTSASTVGLAIVVAVYSVCLMAALIFFYLRPQHCKTSKERKPKFAPKDTKSVQSSSPQTNYLNDVTHNYQDLDDDDKDSYELIQASANLCAYQKIEHTT